MFGGGCGLKFTNFGGGRCVFRQPARTNAVYIHGIYILCMVCFLPSVVLLLLMMMISGGTGIGTESEETVTVVAKMCSQLRNMRSATSDYVADCWSC